MLSDQPLRDVLASFAAAGPAPAGGSASALAAAVGVSLLIMASRLAETATEPVALTRLQRTLIEAIDHDPVVFATVLAARRLPRATPGERAFRDAALRQAWRDATDGPLEVMRAASAALDEARGVATAAPRSAVSDVRVAIGLVRAGYDGARSTVEDNLTQITDGVYVESARADIAALSRDVDRAAEAAAGALPGT